ncbi:hypothetical protein B0H13DRAFT_1894899 [Mycena leptocephala]|nr:hypothetical protein B0H13DRAFT_1894899 [Mycena leptocephala]
MHSSALLFEFLASTMFPNMHSIAFAHLFAAKPKLNKRDQVLIGYRYVQATQKRRALNVDAQPNSGKQSLLDDDDDVRLWKHLVKLGDSESSGRDRWREKLIWNSGADDLRPRLSIFQVQYDALTPAALGCRYRLRPGLTTPRRRQSSAHPRSDSQDRMRHCGMTWVSPSYGAAVCTCSFWNSVH